jgi:Alpha/beta hydrolase domain
MKSFARRASRHAVVWTILVTMAAVSASAQARVIRLVVDKVEKGVANGPEGPGARPIQIITGRAFGELDPRTSVNSIITDLDLAPRNAKGMVEYSAKFTLTKPTDMKTGSGVLWYDVVNRGAPVPANRGAARPIDDGHVMLISGWQGDLVQTDANWTVQVPVAQHPDGSPITGPVLARIADVKPGTTSRPLGVLSYANPYDAAALDTAQLHLVAESSETRSGEVGPSVEVPSSEWAFADCSKAPYPGTPNPRMLCLKNGFAPDRLYQLTYEAKNPKVLGIGLAAIRDIASFFRYEPHDDFGTPNPVAGAITHAISQGISQSGNALKTFLLLGFNQDESGRIVFDGANPHIGGRLTAVNIRFGVASGSGTLYEPGGEGVLWWSSYADKVRGRPTASLLDRCNTSHTCPKIFETFGSTEFNARLMTMALTGTDRAADLPLPANVRRYYFPGTTHNGDPQGGFSRESAPAPGCVLAKNPNPETETMNALERALVEWVVHATEPPASSYPRLSAGDLVQNTREAMGFPSIPNAPSPTGMAVGLIDYNFGPDLRANDFSGVITQQPPRIRNIIASLMPRVGPDGNELMGIPSVLHQAPLGTYTGWNVVSGGFFKGQPCGGGLMGGYIPFARTKSERLASGDPRQSLEERYGTSQGYMCVIRAAAARNVRARYLLGADAARLVTEAEASDPLAGIELSDFNRDTAQRLCRSEANASRP